MKPTIAIVGLLPKQVNIVESRCRNKNVRLRFIESDRKSVPAADAVIIWTNFVSHRLQDAAVATVGRDRVQLFSGGLGALGDLVEDMIERAA